MHNTHSCRNVFIVAFATLAIAPLSQSQIQLTEEPLWPDDEEVELPLPDTPDPGALDADDSQAKASITDEKKPKSFFEQLEKWDLSLTRASEGKTAGQPAAFSYIRSFDTEEGEEDDFTADFFLKWEPKGQKGYSYSMSVEGHLGGENGQAEDAWRFRGTVAEDHDGILGLQSFYGKYSIKYETDKNFDASKLIGEFLFTGTDADLLMGAGDYIGMFAGEKVGFLWEPSIGFDVGYNADPGESNEVEDTILRLVGTVSVYVPVHAVRNWLGVHDFWFYGTAKVRYLPLEEDETAYEFFTLGADFVISENVTLGIQYKNGEDAPTFDAIESLGVTLGVTF